MNKTMFLLILVLLLVGCSSELKTATSQQTTNEQVINQTDTNKSNVMDYDLTSLNVVNRVAESLLAFQDEIINVSNISDERLKSAKELVLTKIESSQNRFKDIQKVPDERTELNNLISNIMNQTQKIKEVILSYKNTKEDKEKVKNEIATINLQMQTFNLKSKELRNNN